MDIDFNDYKNIQLGVYLKTDSKLNDDILNLLKHYKIPLPFKQLQGKIGTDLTLDINLNKKIIQAQGQFKIDKGRFEIFGKHIEVSSGKIFLENSDVSIDSLALGDSNFFSGVVTGKISAKKRVGDLDIDLTDLNWQRHLSIEFYTATR